MATPNKQIGWSNESQLLQSLHHQVSKSSKSCTDPTHNVGIVDVADDETIYLCYPKRGTTSENDASWSIQRITVVGTTYVYEWAFGTTNKVFKASERTTLSYSFLK